MSLCLCCREQALKLGVVNACAVLESNFSFEWLTGRQLKIRKGSVCPGDEMCFTCDVTCPAPFKGGLCWILEAMPLLSALYRTWCWLPSPQLCWARTSVMKRQQIATLAMSLCRQGLCWHLQGLCPACRPLLLLEPSFSWNTPPPFVPFSNVDHGGG